MATVKRIKVFGRKDGIGVQRLYGEVTLDASGVFSMIPREQEFRGYLETVLELNIAGLTRHSDPDEWFSSLWKYFRGPQLSTTKVIQR